CSLRDVERGSRLVQSPRGDAACDCIGCLRPAPRLSRLSSSETTAPARLAQTLVVVTPACGGGAEARGSGVRRAPGRPGAARFETDVCMFIGSSLLGLPGYTWLLKRRRAHRGTCEARH